KERHPELSVRTLSRCFAAARSGGARPTGTASDTRTHGLAEDPVNLHGYLSHLAHPRAVYLLALMPVLSVLAFYARLRARRALARMGSRPSLEALAAGSRFRRRVKSFLVSTRGMPIILALAGPQSGSEPEPAPR